MPWKQKYAIYFAIVVVDFNYGLKIHRMQRELAALTRSRRLASSRMILTHLRDGIEWPIIRALSSFEGHRYDTVSGG